MNLSREEFAALPLAKRLVALQDPMNFLRYCVFTRDERDIDNPIKAAPVWPGLPHYKWYIKPCIKVLSDYRDIIIFDKTRRFWISYAVLSFMLHRCLTRTDLRLGVMTENATKSQEHLKNIKFINDRIPEEIWPQQCRSKLEIKEGLVSFPTDNVNNFIHGLASGPDQARQYGFSMLFFDEMDFWTDQEASWAAAVPTTEQIIVASTHAEQKTGEESFYHRMVDDKIS